MIDTDDFLAHFGVKGMKWGVRREQKRLAKADKKWKKNIYSVPSAVKVHNAGAKIVNAELPALNNNPKYKGKKINWGMYVGDPSVDKVSRDYIRDYMKLNERAVTAAVKEVHGTSPSGKMKAEYENGPFGQRIVVKNVEIQHAAESLPDLIFNLDTDDNGQVTSVQEAEEIVEQSVDPAADFLAHYGVKGMKWGIRKKQPKRVSTDGKEVTRILDKQKKEGVRSLTNHELRVANSRRELETKFEKQNPKPPTLASHGKKFALEVATAAGVGTAAGIYKIATSEAGKAAAAKGIAYLKNSPFLKIGVKALPVNEQLKLF